MSSRLLRLLYWYLTSGSMTSSSLSSSSSFYQWAGTIPLRLSLLYGDTPCAQQCHKMEKRNVKKTKTITAKLHPREETYRCPDLCPLLPAGTEWEISSWQWRLCGVCKVRGRSNGSGDEQRVIECPSFFFSTTIFLLLLLAAAPSVSSHPPSLCPPMSLFTSSCRARRINIAHCQFPIWWVFFLPFALHPRFRPLHLIWRHDICFLPSLSVASKCEAIHGAVLFFNCLSLASPCTWHHQDTRPSLFSFFIFRPKRNRSRHNCTAVPPRTFSVRSRVPAHVQFSSRPMARRICVPKRHMEHTTKSQTKKEHKITTPGKHTEGFCVHFFAAVRNRRSKLVTIPALWGLLEGSDLTYGVWRLGTVLCRRHLHSPPLSRLRKLPLLYCHPHTPFPI